MRAPSPAIVVSSLLAAALSGACSQPSAEALADERKFLLAPALEEDAPLRAPARGARLDAAHAFGDGVVFENLTVWPVLASAERSFGTFRSLDEAMRDGQVTIREAPGGGVGVIEIRNAGKTAVVACAGTLVRGGKQDRQIASDTVIPAGTTARVKVYCVEQGRWDPNRKGRNTSGKFDADGWIATKRVRVSGQYTRDQSLVWGQTRKVSSALFKPEDGSTGHYTLGARGNQYYLSSTLTSVTTGTLYEVIDHEAETTQATRRLMAAAVEGHLEARGDRLVGFAYAIDGEPVTVRTFADAKLLRSHLHSYLRTMAFEAELAARCDRRAGRATWTRPARIEAVQAMVAGIRRAKPKTESTETSRREVRVNGYGGSSVSTVVLPDGTRIEVTQDWTAPVTYGVEALHELGRLQALGYTR